MSSMSLTVSSLPVEIFDKIMKVDHRFSRVRQDLPRQHPLGMLGILKNNFDMVVRIFRNMYRKLRKTHTCKEWIFMTKC